MENKLTMGHQTIAVAILLTIASARGETPEPEDFLSEANSRLLVERLADTEKALAQLEDEAAAHFAPFIEESGSGLALYAYAGVMPGLVSLELRRSILDIPGDNQTVLDLRFAGSQEAETFRALLDETFGPADPSCLDATRAHWSPAPGTSLGWLSDEHDWVDARLWLMPSDPLDANCQRSSMGEDALVDVPEMTALLERLREEPPPFQDASAMVRWLEPYAAVQMDPDGECRREFMALHPPGLSGVTAISGRIDACETDATEHVSRLHIFSSDFDMFARERLAEAAKAAFGPPDSACSTDRYDFWALSDEMVMMVGEAVTMGLEIIGAPSVMVVNMSSEACNVPRDD